MRKTFKLQGLECANCAAKIQEGIERLDGVSSATVSFVTTKLVIDGEENEMEKIIKSAQKIIKRLEPDVVMRKA